MHHSVRGGIRRDLLDPHNHALHPLLDHVVVAVHELEPGQRVCRLRAGTKALMQLDQSRIPEVEQVGLIDREVLEGGDAAQAPDTVRW